MEEVPALPDDILDLGRRLIPSPVFLVGCARSGTSILGEALAVHPRIEYLFEISPMWNVVVPERPDHRLERGDATPEVALAVYEALAREAGDLRGKLLLEKNPKHVLRISFLDALFPWARFCHIVRDGRDTVASLMFRNRGDHWGHLEIPGWREILRRHPEANHIRCAHQWREAVRTAREEGQSLGGERFLELRYEDLVERAGETLGRALKFLGLDADPGVDEFSGKIQDETAGSYHARRQVRHYVENHSRRIGRYRENLGDSQLEEVLDVCGDLLGELGYL